MYHSGLTATSGHYICSVLNGNNWYLYDDDKVTSFDMQFGPSRIVDGNVPYIIVYERCSPCFQKLPSNVPVGTGALKYDSDDCESDDEFGFSDGNAEGDNDENLDSDLDSDVDTDTGDSTCFFL